MREYKFRGKRRVNNFDGGLYLCFEENEVEHDA